MRINDLTVWAVHLLTVSGAGIAVLALLAASQGAWQSVFLLLGIALIIDAVDGPLARRLEVSTRVPWFDGAVLDIVVDYTTYVLVPAMVIAHGELVPTGLGVWAAALVAIVGALYMADTRMKTAESAFRGFPAVWNGVVFLMLVFNFPPAANLTIIVALAILTFAPVEFVHPFRVRNLRPITAFMTVVWGAAALVALMADFRPVGFVLAVLTLASLYFALVGLVLQMDRLRGPKSASVPTDEHDRPRN